MGLFLSTSRNELSGAGPKLWVSLIVFAASILVFSLSEVLILSLVALFFYGASDMVSVNIRMGMVQAATPEQLEGRVAAVNMLFIQTSNEGGDFGRRFGWSSWSRLHGSRWRRIGPRIPRVESEKVSGALYPRQDLRPLATRRDRSYLISVCLAYHGFGQSLETWPTVTLGYL